MDVTFVAGNDAGQMLGAWMCWSRWGLEEFAREIDTRGFLTDYMAKAQSGQFLQVIGWDGAEPVAMVQLHYVPDLILGKHQFFGDHAYVHPKYRNAGVMRSLVQTCIDLAGIMGMKNWYVPVTAGKNATAPFLRKVYESYGFEQIGILMFREAA